MASKSSAASKTRNTHGRSRSCSSVHPPNRKSASKAWPWARSTLFPSRFTVRNCLPAFVLTWSSDASVPNWKCKWRGATVDLRAAVEQLQLEVAERRLAEAALLESEERFRNMADTSPVMIWVSGPDKLCTFFNQRWLTFMGSTMDQALGDGWSSKCASR